MSTEKGRGKWRKGESGNPNGRAKGGVTLSKFIRRTTDVEALTAVLHGIAFGYTVSLDDEKILSVHDGVELLRGEVKAPTASDRLRAIEMLFDRGWGKPLAEVDIVEDSPEAALDFGKLSDDELAALEAMQAKMLAE